MSIATLLSIQYPSEPSDHVDPLIFVVDDSSLMRKLISITLHRAHFRVHSFEDGVELLRALHEPQTTRPDLILLDIVMPRMNGFQVLQALKRLPSIHNCPVVIVSRRTGLLDRLHAHLLGACAWLDKPFTTHDLLAVVRSALAVPPPSTLPTTSTHSTPPL
jgi:DNA-binding response OmpR family regulator